MSGVDAAAYVMRLTLRTPAHKLALLALATRCDQDYSCWPSRALIASEALISPQRAKTILRDLRRDGYVSARQRYRDNKSITSNRYYVHGPWDNYGGSGRPFDEIAYYAERDDRYAAVHDGAFIPRPAPHGAGAADDPSRKADIPDGGGVVGDTWEGSPTTPSAGITRTPSRTDQEQPTRRTPSDVRRTAADGYTARPRPIRVRPRRRPDGFADVAAALPAAVRARPGARLAPTLVRAICEVLEGVPGEEEGTHRIPSRTPEQVIARINRRWHSTRGDERTRRDYTGDDKIRRPVGYLAELIRAQECPDPSCEDGVLIDTGRVCRACRERRAQEQEAARAAEGACDRLRQRLEAPGQQPG